VIIFSFVIVSNLSQLYSTGRVYADVLGLPTPDYRLPFEAEVGAHPSFEEMQVAVSRNKLRPAFSDMWKDTNMVLLTAVLLYLYLCALFA